MTIWLVGKSIDDLTVVPLIRPEGRWNVVPNKLNELYDADGTQFHYELSKGTPQQRVSIANCFGRVNQEFHSFTDSSGTMQIFPYWGIQIWEKIPVQWRDILFHHELTELLELARGGAYPGAHHVATGETDQYLLQFFSPEQRTAFTAEMDTLRGPR